MTRESSPHKVIKLIDTFSQSKKTHVILIYLKILVSYERQCFQNDLATIIANVPYSGHNDMR